MNIYATDDELIASSASPYQLGTAWCWYVRRNGQYDYSHIDCATIDSACRQSATRNDLFVMNIEEWDLENDFDNAVEQLLTAARRWKSNQPKRPIGYYTLIPSRDYWTPVGLCRAIDGGRLADIQKYDNDNTAWMKRNDAAASAMLPYVDFTVASLYEFYVGKEPDWRQYATANINEAMRVAQGKPVYAMLMPCLHDTQTPIPLPQWKRMVQCVTAHTELAGLMIHYSPTYVCDPQWREPVKAAISITP